MFIDLKKLLVQQNVHQFKKCSSKQKKKIKNYKNCTPISKNDPSPHGITRFSCDRPYKVVTSNLINLSYFWQHIKFRLTSTNPTTANLLLSLATH